MQPCSTNTTTGKRISGKAREVNPPWVEMIIGLGGSPERRSSNRPLKAASTAIGVWIAINYKECYEPSHEEGNGQD